MLRQVSYMAITMVHQSARMLSEASLSYIKTKDVSPNKSALSFIMTLFYNKGNDSVESNVKAVLGSIFRSGLVFIQAKSDWNAAARQK